MKNDFFLSFRKKIMLYTLASSIITLAVVLFFLIDLRIIVGVLRSNGFYHAILERQGLYPGIYIGVIALVALSVFISSFYFMMSDMIHYVDEITRGVEHITRGDLNTVIEVKGQDEFSEMAENLNKMTEEIKVIMERERYSERTKNDLITSVAHDLRTPLTSITGYLELLRQNKNLETEIQNKYLDIVYQKSKRLEHLIYDLFDFTKLNHEKISLKLETIDLVKLLEQLLDEFYPSFQENQLEYEFICRHSVISIEADGDLLARLFDNLISNAIKYGADGKMITISLIKAKDTVRVDVINYGKVIPPNELKHIFQKFYRVEQSRSENTGGTGLGLAIAKHIVEMHKGTINVSSSLKGTTFSVTLHYSLREQEEKFVV